MTSSDNIVSVCNRALLSIGARAKISSLSEGSTESDACNILFQTTFEALARSAAWNCLRNQGALTLIAAAQGTPENLDGTTLPLPPVPWLYQYAYPSLCLDIRYLLPSLPNSTPSGTTPLTTASNTNTPWVPTPYQVPFVVAYATDSSNSPIITVLTNLTQAVAVYTVNQPNPSIWDSLFSQAMVSSLAAYLVPALSLNIPLMQMSIKTAEAAILQARVRDGDEGSTSQDHVPDWIRARNSGGWYGGNSYTSCGYANFSPMIWPG